MNREITIIFYNKKGVEVKREPICNDKYLDSWSSIITYANLTCEALTNTITSYKIIF